LNFNRTFDLLEQDGADIGPGLVGGSMKPAGPDRVRELNEDMSGIIGERSQKRES
jgi:hypothetical protein